MFNLDFRASLQPLCLPASTERGYLAILAFYILRTVHLCIILVGNQLEAQFLLWYVYLNPLHVLSNYVLILKRTIV